MEFITLESMIDFIQLPSGQWAGHSRSGVLISLEAYPKGEQPDRFKYEPAKEATREEELQYWEKWEKICQ